MLRNLAGIVLGVCAAASALIAQGTWTPQEGIENLPRGDGVNQQTSTLGWSFEPITNGAEVVGFFGLLEGDDAFGGNVKLMYFAHDSAGVWTSYGWEEDGTDGAVAWIRLVHGANALSRSQRFSSYTTAATPVAPEQMKDGFFVSDPNADLVAVVGPEQAEVIIEWLADAGYKVAPKLSEKIGPGGQQVLNDLMGFLSNQAEYTLYPLKTTYANVNVMVWCSCTSATTTTIMQPPGGPTLDPSTPINPNPVIVAGGCKWKYTRPVSTTTTTFTGKHYPLFLCPSCAKTVTVTNYEHTSVTAPCGTTPAPLPEPGDPWRD
jgi:hypothetical protein